MTATGQPDLRPGGGEAHLTDEAFWDRFWSKQPVPAAINLGFSFERCLSRALEAHVRPGGGRRLLEVGCAPGRWMLFFHNELGYSVEGIDYVPAACRKTRENLALSNVPGRVIEADFFRCDLPGESYDAVVSLGFIEHFSDVEGVIARHAALVRPGGTLVLGIPNFRGVNYWIQKVMDRPLLKAHNTSIMSLKFLRGLSRKCPLEPLWVGYLGGFEPALFGRQDPPAGSGLLGEVGSWVGRKCRWALGVCLGLAHEARNRLKVLDHLNHRLFSSYILGVYRKRHGRE
jgi:SAM-dependent methyltransferase